MNEIQLTARAKINLGLDVVRKREDGYHEVRMIMQMIHLSDRIRMKKQQGEEITVKTNLPYLPVGPDNLVYRAADLLRQEFGIRDGVSIDLQKRIPVAAGMAGGSSDAAAVMVGMNKLFHLGLSKQELMERGVQIGADVPFCIMGGTALAEGIGEQLTRLPAMPHCYLVIAKPGVHVSTKFVYGGLHLETLQEHPDIDGQVQALRDQDLGRLVSLMGNVLETVTVPAYPVIEKIKKTMTDGGAMGAMMSGSGPTVFGVFDREDRAREVYRLLRKQKDAKQVYLIRQ